MKSLAALLRPGDSVFDDYTLALSIRETEMALAKVQGQLGIIPANAAATINERLGRIDLPEGLMERGVKSSGVPVPALIAAWRERLPADAAPYLHWGATSQDIVDTAIVMCCCEYLRLVDRALFELGNGLLARMEAERHTPVMAHTRFQRAVPSVLGLRFASWLAPFVRFRGRIDQLRPRLLVVQFGGAAGNLSALGEAGPSVAQALANELDLGLPPMPWHNQRDNIFELGSLAASLSGHLGKIGQDILLAAQNEVGEMREAEGGGSSTMPNKSNPVRSEALVTIARLAGGKLAALHGALVHSQERDGAAWAIEWEVIPELLDGTLAAMGHANDLVRTLVINDVRMASGIKADGGLALAEAASFVLAREMPRDAAQTLVRQAVAHAKADAMGLLDAIAALHKSGIDKSAVWRLATELPAAQVMIDQVAEAWRRNG